MATAGRARRSRGRTGRYLRALWALCLVLGMWLAAGVLAAEKTPRVAVLLEVEGAIGPATSEFIHTGLEKARELNASVLILRMDTPGGLSSAMRDIIKDILASPIPVVTYVAPSGARAASAGTYILYASHVAAMAPGTNLGAATPVQIGGMPGTPSPPGEEKKPETEKEDGEDGEDGEDKEAEKKPAPTGDAMSKKAISDAAAYIRSLAKLRGRNIEWAEKAVREAASLAADEALPMNVIDLMASDADELLSRIDGRVVKVPDGEVSLETAGATIEVIEPDWRTKLLAVITDPNVAYILMLIGIYGLIFEFSNPGAVVPGVVGAISLILALFAFNVLPINYAGLGLMLLGVALLVAEAFVPSFGALGIGGVIAFAVGSIMLMETDAPGFTISWSLIAGVTATSAAFILIVVGMAVKAHGRPVVSGRAQMIGSEGTVLEWSGHEGRVRVHGEIWRATAAGELMPGQRVRVSALTGLKLTVAPAE